MLGVNLELNSAELATIERNHRGDNTRCKTEVLSRWLENTTCPSWEAVVQALRLMEANAAADAIQRKYNRHIDVILSNCFSIMLHPLGKCVSQIDGSLMDG